MTYGPRNCGGGPPSSSLRVTPGLPPGCCRLEGWRRLGGQRPSEWEACWLCSASRRTVKPFFQDEVARLGFLSVERACRPRLLAEVVRDG